MTSHSTIGTGQQHIEGRTVRDIVEYSPDQVNEAWCRKILRQVLQSLELQYAMRMPHRPITPDTIVFHDNGEPLLVPTPEAPAEGREADDLTALARVIHYAVTGELAPTGPLRGRAPDYSDSLVTAVDRCMAPEAAERPQSIEALRALLGIVPLGLPAGAQALETLESVPAAEPPPMQAAPAQPPSPSMETAPAPPPARLSHPSIEAEAGALPDFLQPSARPRRLGGLGRWQRNALAAGVAALLLALLVVVFSEMRDTASYDQIVLKLPQIPEGRSAAPTDAAPPPATAMADGAAPAPAPVPASATHAAAVPASPAQSVAPAQPGDAAAPAGGVAYKLQIQPWGVVYVNGVDHGVSPPVKRLVLAPGRYAVRVSNPNFHDRELDIDTAQGGGSIAVDFNDAGR